MESVTISQLEGLVRASLAGLGYDSSSTDVLTRWLMYAQLRGNNQGVVKLVGDSLAKHPAERAWSVQHETPSSARIDGGKTNATVVLHHATQLCAKKALATGFAVVALNNTCTSTGAIGYFAKELASQGLIAFVFAGSPELVAPYGSYEARFGTNPVAIAVPTVGAPVVLDMATSAMAFFGILQSKIAGESIPSDVGYDAAGNETTDPAAVLAGAIRVFDRGHKGSGLSMMVELMSNCLSGAAIENKKSAGDGGNTVLAFNPNLLGDADGFKQRAGRIVDLVRGSKRLPGVDRVYTPGEKGDELMEARIKAGKLDVETNLLASLAKAAVRVPSKL